MNYDSGLRVCQTPDNQDSDRLAESLHSTTIRLLRGLRRADHSGGLSTPRLSALSVVVHSGSVTLGELAQAEQVRPPTMTRIVNALVQQQLVLKTRGSEDGRTTRLSATLKGKRLLLRGKSRRVQLLSREIGNLEVDEKMNLSAALDTLRKLAECIKA